MQYNNKTRVSILYINKSLIEIIIYCTNIAYSYCITGRIIASLILAVLFNNYIKIPAMRLGKKLTSV